MLLRQNEKNKKTRTCLKDVGFFMVFKFVNSSFRQGALLKKGWGSNVYFNFQF